MREVMVIVGKMGGVKVIVVKMERWMVTGKMAIVVMVGEVVAAGERWGRQERSREAEES